MDHGSEFMLALVNIAQQHLSPVQLDHSREPVLQSLSCQNHGAERIWPEVNQTVYQAYSPGQGK